MDGRGYIELPRSLFPHRRAQMTEIIELDIITESDNGLIFWHGQTPEGSVPGADFLALAVVGRKGCL